MAGLRISFIIIFVLLMAFLMPLVLITNSYAVNQGGENCTQDIYECTDWGQCLENGTKTRSCTLIEICPRADNTEPLSTTVCEYKSVLSESLKCINYETSKQRIDCRLNLFAEDAPVGLNIAYLPEDCRAKFDANQKDACIRLHSQARECMVYNRDQTDTCLKQVLNLFSLSKRKSDCSSTDCQNKLRQDVYDYAKLRIYELEVRAENMLDLGLISRGQASIIIEGLEQEKIAFDNAPDTNSRKDALMDAKNKWIKFIKDLNEASK